MCGQPAGWHVLADRARLGQPSSRLPTRASVAGLGGAYRGGRPPTACYIGQLKVTQQLL